MKNITREQLERLAANFGYLVPGLKEELESKFGKGGLLEANEGPPLLAPALNEVIARSEGGEEVEERIIATSVGARPVARIRDNQATTEFLGPDSESWANVITASKELIDQAIPAVGRIELNNSDYPWAGTGWLVAPGIVVTNRHVADVFARVEANTSQLVFKPGLLSGFVSADIDFLEEENRADSAEHPITSILWIAPPDEADIAFLQVTKARNISSLPRPIELADEVPQDATIAAIGYPARDPSIRDQELVVRIFGDDVYDKKRLSPGKVKSVEGTVLKHDCSTLGGNSGSVLLDLKTGKAVGIHRAGLLDDSANLAVTAPHLKVLLEKAMRKETPTSEEPTGPSPVRSINPSFPEADTYRMKLHIPIEITVRVGHPVEWVGSGGSVSAGPVTGAPVLVGGVPTDGFEAALQSATQRYGSNPEVLKVRLGYRFKNGWITDERVVVFELHEKLSYKQLQNRGIPSFPREILGVGVDVRTASLPDQLEAMGIDLTVLERPGKPAGYTEPPGYDKPESEMFLGRVRERMSAIFHVSPDAGFQNLQEFLKRIRRNLTATMYEWTPNHISDAIEEAMKPAGRSLRMVTQKRGVGEGDATQSAVEDMKARISGKFKHVWASTRGPHRLIPNSYHIKVASRDGEEVWLSSGNWKDSNQPKNPTKTSMLRTFNREWHAIIKNERLATLFEKYIDYDFRQATRFPLEEPEGIGFPELEFFVPEDTSMLSLELPSITYEDELVIENEELDIQPLLTPDRDAQGRPMFMKFATEMIQRATKKIYVQNQSFSLTAENNREFDEFFSVLMKKQQTIEDVRIIFRDAADYGRPKDLEDQQKLIERLKDFGLNVSPDALRIQPKCHTKGIIVDSNQVLLGSQNLTNGGSLFNRDASLLIRSPKVAAFYEKIFLFDWRNLAHNKADERVGGIRRAQPGEETPIGYRRVKLSELLAEE